MAPSWKKAALAAFSLGCGMVMADMKLFKNVTEFNILSSEAEDFPHQSFRSSDVQAPLFQVNTWDEAEQHDAGYIFLGTVYGQGKAGPMILDAKDLSLVYADQQYQNTYTSDTVVVDGERLFGFWHGYHTRGHANGWCLIFDQHYNLRYNVSAQGLQGALADMHEMKMTTDKTVIFSTYFNILANCTGVGGPEEALLQESGFQEVDMETNEVLFDWAASDHFSLKNSYARYIRAYGVRPDHGSGFDFFHINSVDKTPNGDYLVSSRHFSVITLISGEDGSPIWILGGKQNQFKDLSNGTATNFAWQHDARYINSTHITVFDNHSEKTNFCDENEPCKTRGLHVEINTEDMTARVVKEYFHPEHLNSGAMGGFQNLPNGNVMMGWGYNPTFTEFKPDGTPVMDVQRGRIGRHVADMFAYRVHKGDWKGLPHWPPAIAADSPNNSSANSTIFLSWNGATEVREWYIYGSDDFHTLDGGKNILKKATRTGFETNVTLPTDIKRRYIAGAAISKDGALLGSTIVLDMKTGQPFYTPSEIGSIETVSDEDDDDEELDSEHKDPGSLDWGLVEGNGEDEEHLNESELKDTEKPDPAADSVSSTATGESPAVPTQPQTSSEESKEPAEDKPKPPPQEGQYAFPHETGAMGFASVLLFGAIILGVLYVWKRRHATPVDSEKGYYAKLAED